MRISRIVAYGIEVVWDQPGRHKRSFFIIKEYCRTSKWGHSPMFGRLARWKEIPINDECKILNTEERYRISS